MMDVTKQIQIAVARVDLIVCTILHRLIIIVPLSLLLLLAVLAFRRFAGFEDRGTHWIDYDALGVDITSEGPDDDYTDTWMDGGEDL